MDRAADAWEMGVNDGAERSAPLRDHAIGLRLRRGSAKLGIASAIARVGDRASGARYHDGEAVSGAVAYEGPIGRGDDAARVEGWKGPCARAGERTYNKSQAEQRGDARSHRMASCLTEFRLAKPLDRAP